MFFLWETFNQPDSKIRFFWFPLQKSRTSDRRGGGVVDPGAVGQEDPARLIIGWRQNMTSIAGNSRTERARSRRRNQTGPTGWTVQRPMIEIADKIKNSLDSEKSVSINKKKRPRWKITRHSKRLHHNLSRAKVEKISTFPLKNRTWSLWAIPRQVCKSWWINHLRNQNILLADRSNDVFVKC